jgi:hypothetical protein
MAVEHTALDRNNNCIPPKTALIGSSLSSISPRRSRSPTPFRDIKNHSIFIPPLLVSIPVSTRLFQIFSSSISTLVTLRCTSDVIRPRVVHPRHRLRATSLTSVNCPHPKIQTYKSTHILRSSTSTFCILKYACSASSLLSYSINAYCNESPVLLSRIT